MPSPFDASIAAVFWTGRSVGERSVAEMVKTVKSQAPNVTAILVKSSDGAHWQGHYDATSPGLTVTGPDSLAHWVNVAQAAGLAVHAWCVLNGDDIGGEVQRVLEACAAPGLKSMLLDVEDGQSYFNGGADNARNLILSIRRGLPPDFHLGLIFDPRGQHPKHIYLEEWLPHVQSLHPMVYHNIFGQDPRSALQQAVEATHSFGKALVPMLQAFDNVPASEITQAGRLAFGLGAAGISYFRLGAMGPGEFAALRKVDRPASVISDGGPVTVDPDPARDGAVIVRPGQPGYSEGQYEDLAGEHAWQELVDIHGWTVRYKRTARKQKVYASYAPDLTEAGAYAIEVFVPSARADTQAAVYFVSHHADGQRQERKVSLNQSLYYNQWAGLGYFDLDPALDDSGRVNLVDYSIEDPPRWLAFSALRWRPVSAPAEEPPPAAPEPTYTADGFDAPIGAGEERRSQQLWPGKWKDAWHPKTGYARQYKDSAGNIAYHTGADLNLNEPRFNLDRGAPVYAVASGRVASVGRVGNFWRNIIVIEHDPLPDGATVYSRYAHVEGLRVQEGERVLRGHPIAQVGSSGGAGGNYHLHFDISSTEVLLDHPGHWPGTNLKLVLANYVDPIEFIRQHRPGEV